MQTSQFLRLWCDAVGDRTPASHTPSGCSNHYSTRGQFENIGSRTLIASLKIQSGIPKWRGGHSQEMNSLDEVLDYNRMNPLDEVLDHNRMNPLDEVLDYNRMNPLDELHYYKRMNPLDELLDDNSGPT